jgi:hypothetical protein
MTAGRSSRSAPIRTTNAPDPALPQQLTALETFPPTSGPSGRLLAEGTSRNSRRSRYANAVANYDAAQEAAVGYFDSFYKITDLARCAGALLCH